MARYSIFFEEALAPERTQSCFGDVFSQCAISKRKACCAAS